MRKIGIVACSNGQKMEYKKDNDRLLEMLKIMELEPVISSCIYANDGTFSGFGKERATELMKCYEDPEITDIFDISGGDMANEVLDYLDYERIGKSQATFWGYSDLTTVLNAIYTMTGRTSILYQIKNLVWGLQNLQEQGFSCKKELLEIYKGTSQEEIIGFLGENACGDGKLANSDFHHLQYRWIQGESMEGIVVGGNIRCFLKLAGTKYFPDLTNKILLLEAMGGEVPQMVTYLSQLKQLNVFEKISGILLGTFSKMEQNGCTPTMEELVKMYVGDKLPIAKTKEIGHGNDAKAIEIGGYYKF